MEEQGLAMMGDRSGQQPQLDSQQILQEIVRMLRSGTSPEELLGMGIPQDVIAQAMQLLQQGQKQQVESDGGLATMLAQ